MFDQQNRDAFVPDVTNQVHEISRFLGVHSGGRLVEHEQVRFGGQGSGDLEAALVTIRHGAGDLLAAALESDELKELVGAFYNRFFFCPLESVPDDGTKKG